MRRFCLLLSLILIGISLAGESLSNKTAVVASSQSTNYVSVVKKDDVEKGVNARKRIIRIIANNIS